MALWDRLFPSRRKSSPPMAVLGVAEEVGQHTGEEWRPRPEHGATVAMRRRELLTISRRLGRVDERPRGRLWEVAATLLAGSVTAGAIGLIPFLGQQANPDTVERLIYFGLLGVGVGAAYLCFRASRHIKEANSDTVLAIKADVDLLLEGSIDDGT